MERQIDRRTLLAGAAAGAATLAASSLPRGAEAAAARHVAEAPVTLSFGWWSNGPTKDLAYKAWLHQFELAHPNIRIKAEILPWASYWDKLKTTLAGGAAYDIVGCSMYGSSALDMSHGVFVDLSQLPDFKMVAGSLNAGATAVYNWSGKQYALPSGNALRVLGYNKDLFTKAGVAFPDPVKPMTYAQLLAIARKLTISGGGKTTQYGIMPYGNLDWNELIEMEGGKPYDRSVNPTRVTVNNHAGIKGLADYQSMFTAGVTPSPEHVADFGGGFLTSLQSGKVAIASLGPWDFGTILSSKLNYGIFPNPTILRPAIDVTANAFAIYKGAKNVDAAWTFIKWAVSKQAQLAYATFSDIPANKAAFAEMASVIKPAAFVPTLLAQVKASQTLVASASANLNTTLTNIAQDLARGKLTPAQAAKQMDDQGTAAITG